MLTGWRGLLGRVEGGPPRQGGRVVAHPTSMACRRRSPDGPARARLAAAPPGDRLPLLPSGPDGGHGPELRRTRPSAPMPSEQTRERTPSVGNSTPL